MMVQTLPILLLVLGMAQMTWTNTFLSLSYEFARRGNGNNCWVWTQVPQNSRRDVALVPIPINMTDRVALFCFHNITMSNRYQMNPGVHGNGTVKHREPKYNHFKGCYTPPFKPGRKVNETRVCKIPRLRIPSNPRIPVNTSCHCNYTEKGIHLGNSSCTTISPQGPPRPVNGTYFVCGLWTYPWLPGMPPGDYSTWERRWGKNNHCYLANVVPRMRMVKDLAEITRTLRDKREIRNTEVLDDRFPHVRDSQVS